MFEVTLNTPTGTVTFSYVICTPTKTCVPRIEDPSVPTVVFLHPVYIGKIIYHQQLGDRELRRFNLVALDLRLHMGTIGRLGVGYGREAAARDVAQVMEALKIPRYHLFGMSMGGCVALQTGILFPERVQSIFVVSSLPLTEPADIGEGRQEIYDLLVESVAAREVPEEGGGGGAFSDALTGCVQLSMSGHQSNLFDAILRRTLAFFPKRPSKAWLDDCRVATVDFFVCREAFTVEALQNIACPVFLVHCGDDVAYPLSMTEEVSDRLRSAGVRVEIRQVPNAPHFGAVTHAKEIDTLFHRFILSHLVGQPPPVPHKVESPFTEELVAAGFTSDSDSEEDCEFFT